MAINIGPKPNIWQDLASGYGAMAGGYGTGYGQHAGQITQGIQNQGQAWTGPLQANQARYQQSAMANQQAYHAMAYQAQSHANALDLQASAHSNAIDTMDHKQQNWLNELSLNDIGMPYDSSSIPSVLMPGGEMSTEYCPSGTCGSPRRTTALAQEMVQTGKKPQDFVSFYKNNYLPSVQPGQQALSDTQLYAQLKTQKMMGGAQQQQQQQQQQMLDSQGMEMRNLDPNIDKEEAANLSQWENELMDIANGESYPPLGQEEPIRVAELQQKIAQARSERPRQKRQPPPGASAQQELQQGNPQHGPRLYYKGRDAHGQAQFGLIPAEKPDANAEKAKAWQEHSAHLQQRAAQYAQSGTPIPQSINGRWSADNLPVDPQVWKEGFTDTNGITRVWDSAKGGVSIHESLAVAQAREQSSLAQEKIKVSADLREAEIKARTHAIDQYNKEYEKDLAAAQAHATHIALEEKEGPNLDKIKVWNPDKYQSEFDAHFNRLRQNRRAASQPAGGAGGGSVKPWQMNWGR